MKSKIDELREEAEKYLESQKYEPTITNPRYWAIQKQIKELEEEQLLRGKEN